MAIELRDQRKYLTDRAEVAVFIQDDFGNVSPHTIALIADRCPHCGHVDDSVPNGVISVDDAVDKLLQSISDHVGVALDKFTAAGMDTTQVMAVRQERLANIAASKTSGATTSTAADAGTAQGG